MCGIFGIVSTGARKCSSSQARRLIESFYLLSESRGKEAAGAALLFEDRIEVLKAPVRGRTFVSLTESRPIVDDFVSALEAGRAFVLIGHTRMVTNGGDHIHGNNQPVIRAGLIAIHNGIIVNEQDLWSAIPKESRHLEVDTEVALALVSHLLGAGQELADAVAQAMRNLQGANTIALMSSRHDGIVLATSNGSMFLAHDEPAGMTIFASERSILERIINEQLHSYTSLKPKNVVQLLSGQLAVIPLQTPKPIITNWQDTSILNTILHSSIRTVIDYDTTGIKSQAPMLSVNRTRQSNIQDITKIDWQAIRGLRRCTRCVLPESFPFIHFDQSGVCNICNNFHPRKLKTEKMLRRELEGIKRGDGKPEILFPISGGRDSCYGLHVLVRDLGMRPVAYTYDWGMVTDLARRNISRMCGKLGVEHILISADIRRKRENIQKNVAAWLRKPHLGTIPLFMAGDKQFFYFANKLKNEMGLTRTLLSINPLERTDFKVGFCGINEFHEKKHYHDLSLLNKLHLLWFYTKQYASNPAYINSSLLDTAFAYFSYYMIPKDFTSMFDYLPWREMEVESVLLNQYDWELSTDTKSTWRIGDGTAAFYNYIYLKVAGFTENDTFRSNQIREGLMTRQEAIERIYQDNQPRIASIAWYFDAISLDAVEAIKVINKIPIHYKSPTHI